MKKRRYLRLSQDIAKKMGFVPTNSGRYRLTKEQEEEVKLLRDPNIKEETEAYSRMSALYSNGDLMTIDDYCEHYGLDRSDIKSWKLVSHTSIPYYNIQSFSDTRDDISVDVEYIKAYIKKDYENIYYNPVPTPSKDKIIVASLADLHFGAYVDNLIKTKPFSIGILAELLQESANIINEYEAKEVHIRLLGDLIESFTGMNHKNSWKGLQKGMIGAEVIKLTTKVLHDSFLARINNLSEIGVIAGNHDRVTSAKEEDTDGDGANLIAWGLSLIGHKVDFNPFVLTKEIDGINYIDLHGHDFISRKSTKSICWDYGKQGVFNFIREGHLHSIIEKLSDSQKDKYQTIKDDAIDHRRMNIPSFFTGNSYSERLGYTSNSGFIVSYNNGKGIPNVDFKAL